MFERIIDWSIENRFLVALATLFVVAAGVYSLSRAPLDAIPDLSDVQVIVYTEYPGQAPRIVEDQVTYPLTTQIACGAVREGSSGIFVFRLFRSYTSSSKTAPTCIGREAASSNT